jgi:hypothetical protein
MESGPWIKADVVKNHDKANEWPLIHQLFLIG